MRSVNLVVFSQFMKRWMIQFPMASLCIDIPIKVGSMMFCFYPTNVVNRSKFSFIFSIVAS